MKKPKASDIFEGDGSSLYRIHKGAVEKEKLLKGFALTCICQMNGAETDIGHKLDCPLAKKS